MCADGRCSAAWIGAIVYFAFCGFVVGAEEGTIKIDLGFTPVELEGGLTYLGPGPAPSTWNLLAPTNINAADTTNADQLWSGGGLGLNLSGAGVSVGIWDGGPVRSTHLELSGRVTVVDSGPAQNHATHVAGTIGAAGINASAHGMANSVQIYSYNWNDDTTEMGAAVSSYDIALSNHSYGYVCGWVRGIDWGVGTVDTWYADRSVYSIEDPYFGKYDTNTQALDTTLYNNPKLLSVWAAGNDRNDQYTNAHGDDKYVTYLSGSPSGTPLGAGWYLVSTSSYSAPPKDGNGGSGYDCLPQQQVAKNSLTVGAINDITDDPYSSGDVSMTSFSSWGPTDDGRLKPDVVANGGSLISSLASSDDAYGSYSGTSMASPNATGTCALLVEHYQNLNGGQLPYSATMKALVMHTATDAGNVGPDYTYGYGVLDGAAAAQLLSDLDAPDSTVFLFEDTFDGTELTYSVLSDGSEPLKVTLAWTDPAPDILPGSGLDDATLVLVNDLDLWLTDNSDTIFYPWTLDPANPGNPAVQTQLNHLDNVVQVWIADATAGWYTIHIGGMLDAAYLSQDYSLIGSGAVVPEPSQIIMLLGLAVMWFARRRLRRG
ncbi:MAG: S8 family serine peptidase [Planctomycetes bacterium]|nr:S8 family serine peptidase [Planctomycetota bacterium]MCG2682317.1 S8 family serine peptidase [Planctomycetales bacterium]